MSVRSKVGLLARGVRNPRGVGGEVRDMLEIRRDQREPQPAGARMGTPPEVAAQIQPALGVDLLAFLDDPGFIAFEARQRERAEREVADHPFPLIFNSSTALARMAYSCVRAIRPEVVLETGVASGLTSSYVTYALERNGSGVLHSIDPAIGDTAAHLGWLVGDGPERARWNLHVGRSRALMPGLLKQLGPIGVFIHDGLHTKPTMRWEVDTVVSALAGPAAVLMDDAESNSAFVDWCLEHNPDAWSLVQTEYAGHVFGLAAFSG
jgi:hypothetical protein